MTKFSKTTSNHLPEEVMLIIFNKLAWRDLLACTLVSKYWHGIIERSHRMRLNCTTAYWHYLDFVPLSSLIRTYRNVRVERIEIDFKMKDLRTIMEECWDMKIDKLESRTFVFLSHFKNLKSLSIYDPKNSRPYDSMETLELTQISQLTYFRLDHFLGDISGDIPVAKMELRHLKLTEVDISDDVMQQIIKLSPYLESLEMYSPPSLTAEAFVSDDGLGAAKRLHTLILPARVINNAVIEKMQLPKLQKLWLIKQKELRASKTAITNTLAKNCPMLMEICGKAGFMARFRRDASAEIFYPVFHGYETESTIGSSDIEEESSWDWDGYDHYDYDDTDEEETSDDDTDSYNTDSEDKDVVSNDRKNDNDIQNVPASADAKGVTEDVNSNVQNDVTVGIVGIDQGGKDDESVESDVNTVYEFVEHNIPDVMDIGANYVIGETGQIERVDEDERDVTKKRKRSL